MVLVTVITWGMYPLLRRFGERHFIRRMDDEGVETRSGKRIAWGELTAIKRVSATMGGAQFSDEYLLTSRKGKVSLPLWRVENANEACDFMFQRLPPNINTR
jgi:hypothetical protein